MERRENISPPLLPPVSKETINEMRMGILNPENSESFRQVGISDKDPLLLSLTIGTPPPFADGGLQVYLLLARETQRTGRKLPHISLQNMQDFAKNHPIAHMVEVEGLLEKGKKLEETKTEYTIPSFQKFRSENPPLMNYLEAYYRGILEMAVDEKNPRIVTIGMIWQAGALYTYDILRFHAEKERMKGLFS